MENVVGNNLKWKTTLEYFPFEHKIGYRQSVLAMGSCFAENVGAWLQRLRYRIRINPFGTLFNPFSLAHSLEWLLSDVPFEASQLFEHKQLFHSFYHHSNFSGTNAEQTLLGIRQALQQSRQQLKNTEWGILTLGTAWVFALQENPDFVVSNCHQLPAARFVRRALSVAEIVEKLGAVLRQWKALEPRLQVVLTVSPIRHLKDGLVENQRSKATLLLATHELCQKYDFIQYFPAYELLVDDLRDYRYYADDLVHPSEAAVQYIAQWFEQIALDPAEHTLRKELYQLYLSEQHRPLHPESEAHAQFLQRLQEKRKALQQQYPYLGW